MSIAHSESADSSLYPRRSPSDLSVAARLACCGLLAMFLLPGLIGHQPWKADEAYTFGLVWSFLHGSDWAVPMLAGEPWVEKPPLFFLIAAGTAKLFSPWFAPHDGARLASGLFAIVTFGAVGAAAAVLWNRRTGWIDALLLAGSAGFILHTRMLLTDLALLSGVALAFYGLALATMQPRRRHAAGLAIGIGVGISFLAKGLLGPGLIGVMAALLPLFAHWRQRSYGLVLLRAALFALPWLIIWPLALYEQSPVLFDEWFWGNNIGRFFGSTTHRLGAVHEQGFWLYTMPWFAWPTLPLAAWWLWAGRQGLPWREPAVCLCLIAVGVIVAVLQSSASARANYGLPLLAPLAVLAAPAIERLSPRADWWLSRVLAALLMAVIAWATWAWSSVWFGHGFPNAAWLAELLPLDAVRERSPRLPIYFAGLTIATLFAAYYVAKMTRTVLAVWLAGINIALGVLLVLWLPWLDAGKGYQSVMTTMAAQLPQPVKCVLSQGLGESERAMLHYYGNIKTARWEVLVGLEGPLAVGAIDRATSAQREQAALDLCDAVIVESRNHLLDDFPPSADWRLVWEGNRPGDQRERFRLFSRR